MAGEAKFKCLRCGAEFPLPYTPGVTEERTCPKCMSNSCRRIKEERKEPSYRRRGHHLERRPR